MKILTFLLAISILFQSCYSYKKVPFNQLKIDASKKYAIKTKKVNGRTFRLNIIKVTDSSVIATKHKKTYIFPKNTILKIEEMKFSFLRTAILSVIIIVPTIFYIALKDLNFDGHNGKDWHWNWI